MSECSCSSVDDLVTAYVDGDLGTPDRVRMDRHLSACPACYSRVSAERAVQQMLASKKDGLQSGCGCAPDLLRARCVELARTSSPSIWRTRLAPLAVAASLVTVVGGAFLYQITLRSSHVMAAELAADHIKCFAMNGVLGTHEGQGAVESALASGFGWNATLPSGQDREDLELVGSRPCFYGEGRIAHVMYRHHGHPVSLFMLPRSQRADEVMTVLGHEATIWSVGDRTFVLVAQEDDNDYRRLASFVRSSLH